MFPLEASRQIDSPPVATLRQLTATKTMHAREIHLGSPRTKTSFETNKQATRTNQFLANVLRSCEDQDKDYFLNIRLRA